VLGQHEVLCRDRSVTVFFMLGQYEVLGRCHLVTCYFVKILGTYLQQNYEIIRLSVMSYGLYILAFFSFLLLLSSTLLLSIIRYSLFVSRLLSFFINFYKTVVQCICNEINCQVGENIGKG